MTPPLQPMAESVAARSPTPEGEDLTAVRQRLWASLGNRRRMTVDTANLQRLLTFVERPLFREPTQSDSLPQIERAPGRLQQRKASEGSLTRMTSFFPERGLPAAVRSETNLFSARQLSILSGPARPTQPLGGVPIEAEIAGTLRKRVYGSTVHSFSSEWRRNHFLFQGERGPFPYGLVTNKDGARGLLLAVQAVLLKHLLYAPHLSDRFRTSYLRPDEATRRECLVRALSDLVWQAGGPRRRAMAVLPSDREYVETSYGYRPDEITERLHLFTFKRLDEVRSFFRRHLETFESPYQHGAILFLYALALSRGLDQLLEDFGGNERECLLGGNEETTPRLLNLLLTGVAREHLHNGNLLYDLDGSVLEQPQVGVQERSDIGLMAWDRDGGGSRVGSMLRTPRFPIWLTRINGQAGLLFSTSAELCSHWRSENKFTLYYYTGLGSQSAVCRLTVDTRRGRSSRRYRTRLTVREDQKKIPALEQCINSKWFGAHVDWNGTSPFV